MVIRMLHIDGLIEAIDNLIVKDTEDFATALETGGFVAAEEASKHMAQMEDDIGEALDSHTDELLRQLLRAEDVGKFLMEHWEEFKSENDLKTMFHGILRDEYISMLEEMTTEWMLAADPILAADQRITLSARQFISDWSEQLADIMQLNTDQMIYSVLAECVNRSLSVEDATLFISESRIRDSGYRARRVAQTEVLRIESYSQLEYMQQDPAVEQKEWWHTGAIKNRPRENHVAISGQVVDVDEPFELIGADGMIYHPMCPRDTCLPASETVNCHCLMKTKKNRKVLGMTDDERKSLRQKYMDEVDAEWENEMAEKEASKPKPEAPHTVVSRKMVDSADFRKKFSALGEEKKAERALWSRATEMLKHRSGTEYEDIAYVNSKTGRSLINRNYSVKHTAKPRKAMDRMLEAAEEYSIIGIHNHPNSGAPSIDDLRTAQLRKYKYGVVVCHNGTVYKYSIIGNVNYPMAEFSLVKIERALYNNTTREVSEELEKLLEAGVRLEVL